MAFKDDLIADLDSETAAYLLFAGGVTDALVRLQTARDVIDGRDEFASYQGIMDKLRAAELKHDPLLRSINLGYDVIFGGHDIDCAKFAADNGISGVTNLKTFLQYINHGAGVVANAAWQYLLAPDTALLWTAATGTTSIAKLTFAPALSDMGHRAAGGSFVAGANVGSDFVDGKINTALYAGAAVLNLLAATITGAGVVQVVGDGYDADGNLMTNNTWSVNVDDDGTFELVPNDAGDIMYKCTNIIIPDTITVGTLTVQCAAPRTNPPV